MTLNKLMGWSESFTDEIQTEDFALGYANKAIADINTEAGLVLPFIEDMDEEYTALPESWFVRLLLPYLNYGIKMNDTSVAEADRYKQEFEISLIKNLSMKMKNVCSRLTQVMPLILVGLEVVDNGGTSTN